MKNTLYTFIVFQMRVSDFHKKNAAFTQHVPICNLNYFRCVTQVFTHFAVIADINSKGIKFNRVFLKFVFLNICLVRISSIRRLVLAANNL